MLRSPRPALPRWARLDPAFRRPVACIAMAVGLTALLTCLTAWKQAPPELACVQYVPEQVACPSPLRHISNQIKFRIILLAVIVIADLGSCGAVLDGHRSLAHPKAAAMPSCQLHF